MHSETLSLGTLLACQLYELGDIFGSRANSSSSRTLAAPPSKFFSKLTQVRTIQFNMLTLL